MAKPVLKVLEEFRIGSVEYRPGQIVPLTDVATWPEGSLPRRLNNRFVEYSLIGEITVDDVQAEDVKRIRAPRV